MPPVASSLLAIVQKLLKKLLFSEWLGLGKTWQNGLSTTTGAFKEVLRRYRLPYGEWSSRQNSP